MPYLKQGDTIPPGFELLHTLRGHENVIWQIAWSPDGRTLASASGDKTVRLWGPAVRTLEGHSGAVGRVSWSPDGRTLVSTSGDETILLWDPTQGELLRTLNGFGSNVAWSLDGQTLASTSSDGTIQLSWQPNDGKALEGHGAGIRQLAWSPDGRTLASASRDKTIRLWDPTEGELIRTLKGHRNVVHSVSWSPAGRTLASASKDRTIRLWDPSNGQERMVLEGHTKSVGCVQFSSNGQCLASKSMDGTVRLWRASTGEPLAILDEPTENYITHGVAFHPTEPILATLGEVEKVIRIWRLDYATLLGGAPTSKSVRYTTAKIVLVGDSGVGKTGLGWRVAHDEFKEHASTHGQQFWVIDKLGTTRSDGTECEAVLWDLAGQPDYRLVHALFLDDVDLALVLFDPTNRQEPLAGADFWLNQLRQRDDTLCPSILLGARADRGTATLTEAELDAYCLRQDVSGGHLGTSALSGEGLSALMDRIRAQVPWDRMTATVTTTTFKRIKEHVLALKEDDERREVLVSPSKLESRLRTLDEDWRFSSDEMMTAVRHLETHGYVTILRGSQGDVSILLAPELLANLASSFVLEARRNPRGLGVLEEDRLLHGQYRFQELDGLAEDEQEILLDAAAVLFLQHNICFREIFNERALLVFPSLINEKRPHDESVESVEDVTYRVAGAVETVYASLVVLLGYTNTFVRTHQWQNQAQYELGPGEICGFRQTAHLDGEIELVLCYGESAPEHVRLLFRGLFERFLSRREVRIVRYQPVVCTACGERLARNVVLAQLDKGRDFSFCNGCGERLALPAAEALTRLPREEAERVDAERAVAERRTAFEAALVRVKALLRDRDEKEKRPSCFISYAWGVPEHERWVERLARDMRHADVDVLFDRWHNPPGTSLSRFTDQVLACDYVVVVGTPGLREKYEARASDPVVASELKLINTRLRQPAKYGPTVIPLLLESEPSRVFTPQLQDVVHVDFTVEELYFAHLFDLIWRLCELPFDHPHLGDWRASMSPRVFP